jgi:hypothetical protein
MMREVTATAQAEGLSRSGGSLQQALRLLDEVEKHPWRG